MRWQELLGERARRMHDVVVNADNARHTEARLFERVRLFDGVALPWWRRPARARAHRVLEEAREHQMTARNWAIEAFDARFIETSTLLDDYRAALMALDAIAHGTTGGTDAMEVAARAIDAAEARMDRFGAMKLREPLQYEFLDGSVAGDA